MNITQLLNSNAFVGQNKPRFIILHGTAGGTDASAIAQFFKGTEGGSNPVSAHYIIGQDGHIVQCNREQDGAWANGVVTQGHDPWWSETNNPNRVTVSIEHCKPSTDNSDQLTDAQKAASFALVKDICDRHNIPKRGARSDGGITGHYSIDPINRSRCPGIYPWDDLWTFLNTGGSTTEMTIDLTIPEVAHFFKAFGQGWLCENGFYIANAMLEFYKSFGSKDLCGLTYLGLPLSGEHGFGGGHTYQRFERGVLIYDPGHTNDNPAGIGVNEQVYMAHIDQGIGQDPQIEILQKELDASTQAQQIAALQGKLKQISTIAGS